MSGFAAGLCTGALGATLAIGFGWSLLRYMEGTAPPPADMTPAPEVRQADASLVLERAPDPKARPVHEVPKDAAVERVIQVVMQPNAESISIPNSLKGTEITWLPRPITFDLSLVRMPDGGRRVIASTPDGMIVKGLDVPVSVPVVRNFRNTAGGAYSLGGGYGAWWHRALGERWVIGAQLRYAPTAGVSADAVLGWRW